MKNSAYLRLAAAVIFVALAIWLGAGIFYGGSQTPAAEKHADASVETVLEGTVIRREVLICAEGDFFVIPDEGQWLCGGDFIAVKRDAASAYFDSLKAASAAKKRGIAEDISSAVFALNVSKNVEERRLASARAAELLYGDDGAENEHIPLPRDTVCAPCPGYFSRFCDGWESVDIDGVFSPRSAEIPEGCIGKIVSGGCWFFRAEPDKKTAEKIQSGGKIQLDGYDAEVWKTDGKTVVFRVKSGVEAYLTDRFTSLRLTIND